MLRNKEAHILAKVQTTVATIPHLHSLSFSHAEEGRVIYHASSLFISPGLAMPLLMPLLPFAVAGCRGWMLAYVSRKKMSSVPCPTRPGTEQYYDNTDQPDNARHDARDAVTATGPRRLLVILTDKHSCRVRGTECQECVGRKCD